MSERPTLHALVAFVSPAFGLCSEPRIMPLADAADYAQFGFTVLVDPSDEAALVRYEQLERSKVTQRRSWLRD